VKKDLQQKKNTEQHLLVMRYAFCTALKLAHPFLPFVTEEIWSVMTEQRLGLLVDSRLPLPSEFEEFRNDKVYQHMDKALKITKEIRSLKSKYFAGAKETPNFYIETNEEDSELASCSDSIEALTKTIVHFDLLGRFRKSDLVGVLFEFDGGKSCRVSVSRVSVLTFFCLCCILTNSGI
jgi:valyl-tRNA synthetase